MRRPASLTARGRQEEDQAEWWCDEDGTVHHRDEGTGQAASVADELAKLVQLRDAGALTDEEFAAQKAKLLGS
jgi:hypothetical protein